MKNLRCNFVIRTGDHQQDVDLCRKPVKIVLTDPTAPRACLLALRYDHAFLIQEQLTEQLHDIGAGCQCFEGAE